MQYPTGQQLNRAIKVWLVKIKNYHKCGLEIKSIQNVYFLSYQGVNRNATIYRFEKSLFQVRFQKSVSTELMLLPKMERGAR